MVYINTVYSFAKCYKTVRSAEKIKFDKYYKNTKKSTNKDK